MGQALPIMSTYAAPLALLFLVLSLRVIHVRRRKRINFGYADDPDLERRVRVHGNFVEYTPVGLLLLALAEGRGAPALWLHLAGASLLIGRLAHAIGVSRKGTDEVGRIIGMAGSQTSILIAAVLLWIPIH